MTPKMWRIQTLVGLSHEELEGLIKEHNELYEEWRKITMTPAQPAPVDHEAAKRWAAMVVPQADRNVA